MNQGMIFGLLSAAMGCDFVVVKGNSDHLGPTLALAMNEGTISDAATTKNDEGQYAVTFRVRASGEELHGLACMLNELGIVSIEAKLPTD